MNKPCEQQLLDFVPQNCRFANEIITTTTTTTTTKQHPRRTLTLANVLAGRRVVFFGDSLLRQVYISLGCLLYGRGAVTQFYFPWPTCTNDSSQAKQLSSNLTLNHRDAERQKQHLLNACPEGLVNCRWCGPQSSVPYKPMVIRIGGRRTRNSATLETQYFHNTKFNYLSSRDVLITEAGAHGSDPATTKLLRRTLGGYLQSHHSRNHHPILIHIVTWSSHFATDQGRYRPTLLEERKAANLSLQCLRSVPFDRMGMEMAVLGERKWALPVDNTSTSSTITNSTTSTTPALFSVLDHMAGVIWINGTNHQGEFKVGQGGGPYNDCQHFCQPGPPDEFARALETTRSMLLQVLSGGGGGTTKDSTSAKVPTYLEVVASAAERRQPKIKKRKQGTLPPISNVTDEG